MELFYIVSKTNGVVVTIIDDVFNQVEYQVRFEWGAEGVRRLAPLSQVIVIIDVLSFTTCVEVAVSRESLVFPYIYKDESAVAFAESVTATLAGKRGQTPSLSPNTLFSLTPQTRIVLPSPNGSTCTVIAKESNATTIAGCLRNAFAVSEYINEHFPGEVVSVIACGEQWKGGMLRPAIEDLIAAGAILSRFNQSCLSPEAKLAVSAFKHAEGDIQNILKECSSGRELIEKGFPEDVVIASELNISQIVPVFHEGAYMQPGAR
ncbi:2-phosphosulfolactate phosphatase [Paenibacillus eucommiae]|uniref:Probable 2-phosphosulfolactate phosphatase n=1 Tax=Paenibacillus eucommiae TaxID=1355755 RepID=A0ABS4IVZ5_9BACL|nr:2-phosphosulfolactate phosphatase [Paenibacillus eucommiae]MBP1991171.1 2-phosphosulfolactate phosphatase [Paenibacillus eucommiae]